MNILKALVVGPLCGLFFCLPAQAQKTKAQLNTEITTTFPDNTVGAITPTGLRLVSSDIANSIMPTAPVVAGNLACFNGTTGLLQDCGSSPATVPLAIGITPIGNGTTTRVIYDNAGILGEYLISGTGNVCMTTSCLMTTPNLGTPSAATLTNAIGLPVSTGISGLGTGIATALGINVGTAGAPVVNGGVLGTPSSGTATNLTGLPISSGVSGLGTSVAATLANNLNATGGLISPTPTRAGDIVYWNGSTWVTLAGNNSGTLTLQENASGVPVWASVAGTGTVTSVICGTFMTGGTITTSGTCNVTAVAKSDQTTGTSNVLAVTPLHQQDHDSAEKAWVNFANSGINGAQTLNASYNVTSVSRTALGTLTVTFTTSFATANYVCTGNSSSGSNSWMQMSTAAAGSIVVLFLSNSSTAVDSGGMLSCRGRQ